MKMKAYKATNMDMTCRGFQFEIGKEYEQDGEIECCNNGFHACKNPLDVLDYYDLTESRFFEVEQSGVVSDEEKETASSKVLFKVEIGLPGFIKAAFEYIKSEGDIESGNYSKLAASGYDSKLAASGKDSVVVSAGYRSKVKGVNGTLVCLTHFVDGKPEKFTTGKIGENGLKENVFLHAR